MIVGENTSYLLRPSIMPPVKVPQDELTRRLHLWQELRAAGGPDGVRPELVKRLRLHIGQQGVFRDLERTATVGRPASGIAVGVLHTGRVYSDDLSDNGLIYHYPVTVRGRRDANEISSIKACREFGLPLFVVITPYPKAPIRNVRLGWVVDYDDQAGQLLIAFGETEPEPRPNLSADFPFRLFETRSTRRTPAKTRPKQWRFRFDVIKRYGATCAVCPVADPLIQAAHLCSVEAGGSDDARNGLIFCLNHHRAFDIGLLRINPFDLSVSAPDSVGVTRKSLEHLPQLPHHEALLWAWERALSRQDLDLARSLRASLPPCAGPADQNKEEMI
jgi:putative restriction endonuclease